MSIATVAVNDSIEDIGSHFTKKGYYVTTNADEELKKSCVEVVHVGEQSLFIMVSGFYKSYATIIAELRDNFMVV